MAFSISGIQKRRGESFLLRTEEWGYIQYNEDASAGIELYDMIGDPGQFNNLAGNPAYAEVVSEFRKKLRGKLEEVRTNDLGNIY